MHSIRIFQFSNFQAPKAPRPQSFNYAPAPAAPVVENRKPVYAAASPAPPQYYYEDEQEQPTQRPIQITRPKYSIPTQPPQQPRPQPPPQPQQLQVQQPQYMREFDFSFDPQPARQTVKSMAPFYQQFENRQPVQFPAEGEASVPSTRAQEYSLFSPADARADTYKPKVRSIRIIAKGRKRRKRKNRFFIIVRKRRRYVD